jgi:hypothetical protein
MRRFRLLFLLTVFQGIELPENRAFPQDFARDEPSSDAEIRPESLLVVSGDVQVRIDGPKLWTLSRVEYDGIRLGVEESAYGTAINFRGAGFLGSAHRLDVPGRPGEIEEEQVTALKFLVDGRSWQPPSLNERVDCSVFEMQRESTIRNVSLKSELQVQQNTIRETVDLHAGQQTEVKVLYPLMYAWNSSADLWMMGDDKRETRNGRFRKEAADTSDVIYEKSARWAAVYDSVRQVGAVTSFTLHGGNSEHALQIIDAPGVYRKLYLVSLSESAVPKGFSARYTATTGFFRAEAAQWSMQAIKLSDELQQSNTR